MTRAFEQALRALLLLPAFIPLIFIDGLLYPYVTPKTLVFRTAAVLLAATLSYLVLIGRPFYFERFRWPVTWIPGALLAVAYLASLQGIDFYHSFWSVFDRGDGLLTLTALTIYFYAFLACADRAFFIRLLTMVTWVASGVALYALLQWFQVLSGVDWPLVATVRGRIASTLGNAAYLAGYLGLTLFLSIIALPEQVGLTRKIFMVGIVLQLFAILLSATRGTLLALVVVGIVALGYFSFQRTAYKTYARIALVALFLVAGVFISFREQLVSVPFELVHRLATISLSDETISSRLFLLKHLTPLALERPFLGSGAEHIDVAFNTVYDPTKLAEQWFDRSHNAYLDALVQYGLLGLGAYLAFIVAFFVLAYRLWHRREFAGAPLLLFGGVYAVQNLFLFDIASTLWLMLMAFAGAILFLHHAETKSLVRLPQRVAIAIAALVATVTIPVGVLPTLANIHLARAHYYQVGDVGRSVQAMRTGLSLNTYADLEYGYEAYQMYTEHQKEKLSGEERLIVYRNAIEILEKNFARYPYDGRTATFLGHLLVENPPESGSDEQKARTVLKRAIDLSPKRSQSWIMLANISIRKADKLSQGAERASLYHEAIQVMAEYAARVPLSPEPRFVLASLYLLVQDQEEAKRWADEAITLYRKDSFIARRAARYYIMVENWPRAADMLSDIVAEDKTDYLSLMDLAKAAFLAGDKGRALAAVRILREKAPEMLTSEPSFTKAVVDYEQSL